MQVRCLLSISFSDNLTDFKMPQFQKKSNVLEAIYNSAFMECAKKPFYGIHKCRDGFLKKIFGHFPLERKKNTFCAHKCAFACGNKSFIWGLAIRQWAPIPGLPSILFIGHILLPSLKRDPAKQHFGGCNMDGSFQPLVTTYRAVSQF